MPIDYGTNDVTTSGNFSADRVSCNRCIRDYADYDSIDGDIDFETTGSVSAIEASSTVLVNTSSSLYLLNLFGNSIDGEIKTFFNIGPGTLTVVHRHHQTEGDIVTPAGADIVLVSGGAVTLQNVYHPSYSENNWIVIACCNHASSSSSS